LRRLPRVPHWSASPRSCTRSSSASPSPLQCPPATALDTLSLHDALPICRSMPAAIAADPDDFLRLHPRRAAAGAGERQHAEDEGDRKSTRLNSSHQIISYAVFCLKKKKAARSGRGRVTWVGDDGVCTTSP